ncbi:leucine Rich repeat-containing domain protein [Ostertagia ostertagi]
MIITIGAVEAFSQLPSTLEGRGWTFDHFVLDETILLLLPPSLRRDLSISAGGSLRITNLHFLRGKRLESLALQRSFISSADLVVLTDMASSLATLDLTSCVNVTDGLLLGQLHNLRCLYLGNNRELTDESVLGICTGCPRLQRLSLDNCAMLSNIHWLCPSELKWLCLAGVSAVDDHVLARLTNCRQIQMLDIKFCRNVTEVGLMVILNLPMLARLEVQGVRAYSNRLLQNVKRVPTTILSDCLVHLPLRLPPLPSPAVS